VSQTASLRAQAETLGQSLPALLAEAEHLAATVLLGEHGRRRAGQGDEFWQYRPAHAGDPARAMDWRRSARSDAHFVREREWQVAQSVSLWIDSATAMRFSGDPARGSKADRARVLGLALAVLLSGAMLSVLALLRLGSYVRFIPYPVTLGFTAGIAVIIFASQIKDLFGLSLLGEPAAILPKLAALWEARASLNASAAAVAIATIALIVGIKRISPGLPNMLIAVAVAGLASFALQLPVETIYSRFGDLPRSPPAPSLPPLSMDLVMVALPWAISFTLLGAIESLLSAVVADGMSGRRHRPNAELLAQGVANIASALFGGICVTGTIARTATNVRAGSKGPVSGMIHAVFVLLFMLIAAPLAGYIPLAALAGLLAVVAWNMAEKAEFWHCLRASRADAVVLLVTFGLVVFRDLSEGIVAGFALGGLVFIHRMSEAASVEAPVVTEPLSQFPDLAVHRLHGPYFFGAAARLGAALDQLAEAPRGLAVDFTDVPFIDSTGAHSFALLAQKMARKHEILYLIGARPEVAKALKQAGLAAPEACFVDSLAELN